jgi:hypothetical protein
LKRSTDPTKRSPSQLPRLKYAKKELSDAVFVAQKNLKVLDGGCGVMFLGG